MKKELEGLKEGNDKDMQWGLQHSRNKRIDKWQATMGCMDSGFKIHLHPWHRSSITV